MTLRVVARAAFAAVVVMVMQFGAAAQPAPDLWTVTNVPVDATAASPSAAKEAALAQGRQKAWTEVFHRLTPSAAWTRQPPLTDLELEPMVKSFDIGGEKLSSTRYLAAVTYVFNPQAVRAALRKTGTQFSESKAKPILVIALSGTAWQPDSAWGKAWAAQSLLGRLVPVAVPNAQDRADVAAVTAASEWTAVKPLADRYGASSVLVAAATKSAAGVGVNMTQIGPQGRVPRTASFPTKAGEDELIVANRAASAVADSLQEDWKRTTSVDYAQQTSLNILVPFNSLAEWVSMRRNLEGTRLIQVLSVEELNMRNAKVRVDYVGKVDQLQTALAQANLSLAADAQGNWTLSRNAGATP